VYDTSSEIFCEAPSFSEVTFASYAVNMENMAIPEATQSHRDTMRARENESAGMKAREVTSQAAPRSSFRAREIRSPVGFMAKD
jgi:hypothetical protein